MLVEEEILLWISIRLIVSGHVVLLVYITANSDQSKEKDYAFGNFNVTKYGNKK